MRILHTADWHLRDSDIDECRKCVEAIVAHAQGQPPDLIIIAGDIFDSQEVRMRSQAARLAVSSILAMSQVAPVHILLGTPSHDSLAPLLFDGIDRNRIHVSSTPDQVVLIDGGFQILSPTRPVIGEKLEAVISALPAVTKQYFQGHTNGASIADGNADIAAAMTAIFTGFAAEAHAFPSAPHILVGHWNVVGSKISDRQTMTGREIEVTRAQIDEARADLVALGHIHYHQKLGKNIWFPGDIYRKDFGEVEKKGFLIHEFSPEKKLKSKFVETPTRLMVTLAADLTKRGEDWSNYDLWAEISTSEVAGAIVRYQIRVYTDHAKRVNQAEIERELIEAGALSVDVQLARIPREVPRSMRLLQIPRLADKVAEMATIKGQTLPELALVLAQDLETESPEAIIESVYKQIGEGVAV